MGKSGLTAVVLPFVLCLPCLLVLLGAAGGIALAAGAVAWLAGNAAIAVAIGGALGTAVILKRKRGATCEVDADALEDRETRRW